MSSLYHPDYSIPKLSPPASKLVIPPNASLESRSGLITDYIRDLYAQYGLTHWSFGFDKGKRRAGYCQGGRKKLITLSSYFCIYNKAEEIQATIVHEIAHAIDNERRGCSDHSAVWKEIAIALGDDGERCLDTHKVVMPKGKHLYECPNCKKEIRKHKRYTTGTACGTCCNKHNKGRYDAKYQLVYKGVKPVPISIPNLSSHSSVPIQTKSQRMIELYDSGITSISEIAKLTRAHYSFVYSVIAKHKKA